MKQWIAAALAAIAPMAFGAQVEVLSAGAAEAPFREAAQAWEHASGNTVKAAAL